ncbi:uncharacterized protein C21orf140 homolog [Engraulis encrasicolus]|uniref:uncharacterized protein C21orf140 homolog n=1 Tax=Engraulis encrasicolus TaxID=184585 RepID=UPI002FD3E90C
MRLRLRHLFQRMWKRSNNHGPQCTEFIKDIRQLQSNGFYRVYLGETEIPEYLITGEITSASIHDENRRHTWSVIHAGGVRGWVPWNYKLLFHLNSRSLEPSEDIFQEFCVTLAESYGRCAVVVDPQSWRTPRRYPSTGTGHNPPSSPIDLLPMRCCPKVAEEFGHKMIQLPFQCAHLNPLNSAWSTVKWFAVNNRGKYSEAIYDRDTVQKYIFCTELIDGSLRKMTKRKWEEAMSRVWKNENYYMGEKNR